jgi:uncharacterized protein YjbI with pentapeptide repeats
VDIEQASQATNRNGPSRAEPLPNAAHDRLSTRHHETYRTALAALKQGRIDEWNALWPGLKDRLLPNNPDQPDGTTARNRISREALDGLQPGADLTGINLESASFQSGALPKGVRLRHANLSHADLSGVRLEDAELSGAILTGANLTDCVLHRALLRDADFSDATLDGCKFSEALIDRANFTGAHTDEAGATFKRASLRGAILCDTRLPNAVFDSADLSGADLSGALLTGTSWQVARLHAATLKGANLNGAVLTGAELRGAVTARASFNEADLRYVHHITFDENEVRGTRFTSTFGPVAAIRGIAAVISGLVSVLAQRKPDLRDQVKQVWRQQRITGIDDHWSQLRRTYTGSNFFLTLLFLVAFAIPYVVRTAGLVAVSEWEPQLVRIVEEQVTSSPYPNVDLAKRLDDYYESKPRYDIWQILLGLHRDQFGATAVVVLLLIYNVLRYTLTVAVVPMREAEDRSGITPEKGEYKMIYPLHAVARWLGWGAVIISLYHAWHWLRADIVVLW